jgi:hypothetical protein
MSTVARAAFVRSRRRRQSATLHVQRHAVLLARLAISRSLRANLHHVLGHREDSRQQASERAPALTAQGRFRLREGRRPSVSSSRDSGCVGRSRCLSARRPPPAGVVVASARAGVGSACSGRVWLAGRAGATDGGGRGASSPVSAPPGADVCRLMFVKREIMTARLGSDYG